jgi:hypothetical protein
VSWLVVAVGPVRLCGWSPWHMLTQDRLFCRTAASVVLVVQFVPLSVGTSLPIPCRDFGRPVTAVIGVKKLAWQPPQLEPPVVGSPPPSRTPLMWRPPATLMVPSRLTVPGWHWLQAVAEAATPVWATDGGKPWQLPQVAAVVLFHDQLFPTEPVKPTAMVAPWQ